MSVFWNCLIFLMIRLGMKTTEEGGIHLTPLQGHIHDLSLSLLHLITGLRECLLDFFTAKLLFFSHSICYPLQEVTMQNPHLRKELYFNSLRWSIYINYLELSYKRGLSLLSIYLFFSHLSILVQTHGYLFYTSSHNTKLFYLFCCPHCSRFGH